jgi:hypothetical protein
MKQNVQKKSGTVRLAVALVAAVLLTPVSLFAADASCTIFAPEQIFTGQTFDIRVSRVPGYPGGWFVPTITIKVDYPTTSGYEYSQIDRRTISEMGVIRSDAILYAPSSLYPVPEGGIVTGGEVNITAVVSESGGVTRTLCKTNSVITP